ncbi:MAG: hypothetical protein QM733_06950 [Ilumatobacteraceae bacterium]
MDEWYHRLITERHRVPLLLCFAAFVVTFFVTRTITRLIRAGKGPFKNNVSASGTHVHHAVPGSILLIVGAFIAVGTATRPWLEIAAVMVGIGTSLVLDEFALILHMSDVYWSEQGRLSVEVVSLTIACMGLFLAGLNPFDFTDAVGDRITLAGIVTGIGFHFSIVAVCLWKGKVELAILGAFVPFVAIVAAIRMARPESHWAQRFYNARKLARAKARAARFDRRFGRFTNFVGGFVASPAVLAADEEARQAAAAKAREAKDAAKHRREPATTD